MDLVFRLSTGITDMQHRSFLQGSIGIHFLTADNPDSDSQNSCNRILTVFSIFKFGQVEHHARAADAVQVDPSLDITETPQRLGGY